MGCRPVNINSIVRTRCGVLVVGVGLVWVGFFCTPNTVAKSQGCEH